MGEAKRRREQIDEVVDQLTRELMNQGKLVEAGFTLFAAKVIPKDASQVQRDEMLLAFMAGAQHVFSSMINALDPSADEPTDADFRRMDLLNQELEQWAAWLSERIMPAQGRA